MGYRLGLDLGTNSIGWTALTIDPAKDGLDRFSLLDMGVRIFPDSREPAKGGRVGDSLAVARRIGRGMRRNRDRGKNRMTYMMRYLIDLGLMPSDKEVRRGLEALNPYQLRAEGLERPLSPFELGRALFQLGLRRGFKSNRKENKDATQETARTQQISALREALGNKTLGQFLWLRLQAGEPVRFKEGTDWFPDRTMYADEFNALKDAQLPHHQLSEEEWDRLRDNCILFQHPLRPVDRGRCTLRPEYRRAHRDTPIAQWFRIYQDVGNLRWIDEELQSHPLTPEQRDAIVQTLLTQKSVTWGGIRKLKAVDGKPLFHRDYRFNLESEQRKKLDGHKIAIWMKADERLQDLWETILPDTLDDIFEDLHGTLEDDKLIPHLIRKHKITQEQAEAFASLPLGSMTVNLSRQAMEELLPIMRDQGLEYFDAVTQLCDEQGNPLHHSALARVEKSEKLPYYGEILSQSVMGEDATKDPETDPEGHFGRIANPTVHVALNQLRVLVNSLIDRFGEAPAEIHVELSRDLKLGPKQRNEINKEIAKNTKRNEKLTVLWQDISKGRDATARDLKKVKLWEELSTDIMARRCVFTGKNIAGHHLVNGEVEIEHILPFSRTLDDTMANLTLSFKGANRVKGNNSPFEAFGDNRHPDFDWEGILDRASRLPKNKRWRFAEGAMEKWEGENDFIARQMTDNAYIARSARKYLNCLTDNVVPAPGRLTAMLRGKWHLNLGEDGRKSRADHRHHAIDAFVVALSDRSVLQRVSRLSARGADDRLHLDIPELPSQLRQEFKEKLDNVLISYKQDHGIQGRYFNETSYGVLPESQHREGYNLVTRKPIASLSPKELDAIRDPLIQANVKEHLYDLGWYDLSKADQVKKLPEYLSAFGKAHNIHRLRILVKNQSAIPIQSAPHKAYAPDSYVCCDIWVLPKGKKGKWKQGEETWQGVFWNYAECAKFSPGLPDQNVQKPHPAARFVMRIFKDDMVSYLEDGREHIMRVAGFSTTNNRLDLKPHNLADAPQKFFSINALGDKGLCQVFVSPDGRYLNKRRNP